MSKNDVLILFRMNMHVMDMMFCVVAMKSLDATRTDLSYITALYVVLLHCCFNETVAQIL